MYMPGWKIVLNGTTIVEDSANHGTSGTPEPYQTTKTLPVNTNTTYTFTPPSGGLTANVLMVAGGGGGGGHIAGGGGAGGLVYTADTSLAQGATKTIVVGNGGNGGHSNSAEARTASVSGGRYNVAADYYSWVGGGYDNKADGWYASLMGGAFNFSTGECGVLVGGDSQVNSTDLCDVVP